MTLRQVDAWDETLALHAALQSRVCVQVSSTGGYLHDWTGTVERINSKERHCFIDGHMVWFSWLIRLTTPEGDVIENPNSMKVWKSAQAERAEEKRATERVRNDEWFVPTQLRNTITAINEVAVTYNGNRATAFRATYGWGNRDVLLLAKTVSLAERVFRLIGTDERFWTISGAMLKARALWLPWHEMMTWCCRRAEELRRGMPPLAISCTQEQEQERTAWYVENGLKITDYTCWQSTRVLETYSEVNWEALFDWAEGKSAKALAGFMTKAWYSNEFLPANGGDIEFETVQTLKAAGLIEWEPDKEFTLRELAEFVSVKELRMWIAEANSKFRARTGDALRDHLLEIYPPFLAERLIQRTPERRLRMVQPAGWTWEEFQQVRKLYQGMTEDLQHYQFNGRARDKAGPFLTPNNAVKLVNN